MKTKLLSLAAIFAIALFSNSATAQTTSTNADNSDTVTVNARATIVAPIRISWDEVNLEFGSVISNTGTVVVNTSGARTVAPLSLNSGSTQGTTSTAPGFQVTGETGYTYSITLPADNVVKLTHATVLTDQMNLTDFNASVGPTAGVLTAGTQNFKVGATLQVVGSLTAGLYTGTFDVTVAYN